MMHLGIWMMYSGAWTMYAYDATVASMWQVPVA
jgi:hypothetical protein